MPLEYTGKACRAILVDRTALDDEAISGRNIADGLDIARDVYGGNVWNER
jgi:hypothetical protein